MPKFIEINRVTHATRQILGENQISETLDDIIGIFAKWMAHSDQRNDFVVLNWY